MGVTFSTLWSRLFLRKETKVLILGLDNAGKSTILYRITMGSVVASAPTVGSNHEIYDYKGVRFGLIDIGGQTSLRSSWSQYFAGTSAIILVIDSSDSARLPLAKAELKRLVSDDSLRTSLLLVLANKQDLPTNQGRLTPAQVSEALGLTDLREREWQIMGCSALTGEGLFEGMDWLVGKLAR
ncbi:putative ADP-ribosylation factor [Kockovaella imperatae]|uniref:Putative ADP-ribosylation factor n=1 Tax=Kockovaella imperatae TaxID=4999 RepID=A0A1Y1URS7_9TREE|nr:putative ADP-ribosylation factor [Kockovaella imperatae]ORX40669.1 putative ADP-ribosylation factor [Kockovaella imperatae]